MRSYLSVGAPAAKPFVMPSMSSLVLAVPKSAPRWANPAGGARSLVHPQEGAP